MSLDGEETNKTWISNNIEAQQHGKGERDRVQSESEQSIRTQQSRKRLSSKLQPGGRNLPLFLRVQHLRAHTVWYTPTMPRTVLKSSKNPSMIPSIKSSG